MTLVSDDGCTMSIDDRPEGALPKVQPWLTKYGIGNDISQGANAWPGVFVSGKIYQIKIHYSQVWYKPGIGDMDGISVILCLTPIDLEVPASIETNRGTANDTEKPKITYKKATELNIATWENSFTLDGFEKKVRWWIMNDMDHFRIHIPRPDKKGTGSIKVTVETKHPSSLSEYDDPESEVELKEMTDKPGEFETVMMLVADDVDKAVGPQWLKKASVGGDVIIRYEGSQIAKLKVTPKGRIRIFPFVLRYHGWFSVYPAVQDAVVADDIKDVRERFAQAGLQVDWNKQVSGIDVNVVPGVSDEFKKDGMYSNAGNGVHPDEKALMDYIKATYPNVTDKDIIIVHSLGYWQPNVQNIWAYHDSGGYTLIPTAAAAGGTRSFSVIAADHGLHVAAHEMLHVLLNDVHKGDFPGSPERGNHIIEFHFNRRVWSGGPDKGLYTDRKRMSRTVDSYVIPGAPGSPGVLNSPFVQPLSTSP